MPKPPSISLAEQAASRITAMIQTEHRFRLGDKLPNEMELSEELGISRITLREAIRILSTRGILEVRRGRGTFVTSIPSGESGQAEDSGGIPELAASLEELLDGCMAVEPAAAGRAARYAEETALEELDLLYLRMERQAAAGKSVLAEERDFHNTLAVVSRSRVFSWMLPPLNRALYREESGLRENAAFVLQDHRELVRCLRNRNPEGARAMALLHILHMYQSSGIDVE